MSNFPALSSKATATSSKPARVLVIKGPNKQGKKAAGGSQKPKNVWDKVASAATVAASGASPSRTSSGQTSARSSPQTSRPSSPVNKTPSKTTWSSGTTSKTSNSQDFPTLKTQSFPSLPKAPPKHQIVMNMRRNTSGSNISNAWGSSSSNNEEFSSPSATTDPPGGKKKKGRKNNVLFRVGL